MYLKIQKRIIGREKQITGDSSSTILKIPLPCHKKKKKVFLKIFKERKKITQKKAL